MPGYPRRLSFALLCLAFLLPALAACGDSNSASPSAYSGPYAAFAGTWEGERDGYLSRNTYDFMKKRIAYATVKKDDPKYRSVGYIFSFEPEIKDGVLRLAFKMYNDDVAQEWKSSPDGSMTGTTTITSPYSHVKPFVETFQRSRPDNGNDGLFAKIVPLYDGMGGEWIDPDSGKSILRIDTAAGKVTLLDEQMRERLESVIPYGDPMEEPLRKGIVDAMRYDEKIDPQRDRRTAGLLLFRYKDGGSYRQVLIEAEDPTKSPLRIRVTMGAQRYSSPWLVTK